MDFFYSLFLRFLAPTSMAVVLLLASVALKKYKVWARACFWTALGVLLVCGNRWFVEGLARHLEYRYLPPNPVPQADCILILGGGVLGHNPPRPTVEIGDAGDRLVYGAHLFRQGKAPRIICTGNVGTGGAALRPEAEDMAEFLVMIGVDKDAIITEMKSQNTRDHGLYLRPLFQERGYKRVLLVTSAAHMPRSMGVFRKFCPGVEFIAAPTDFQAPDRAPEPWYHRLYDFVPTPRNLQLFEEIAHEYLGLTYYKLRGWL